MKLKAYEPECGGGIELATFVLATFVVLESVCVVRERLARRYGSHSAEILVTCRSLREQADKKECRNSSKVR
jgi:hypothetical protein